MKNILGMILLLYVPLTWAQSRVEDGGHEVQLWTGGGHSVPGGTSNTGVWNVGLRYGWILTRPQCLPLWCSNLPTQRTESVSIR